jgi:Cys-tRNA(Pro)/Cys-tRNA(Cys) deacylase
VTPAVVALRRAGVDHEIREYELAADVTEYGPAAAAALGLDPAIVAKTLVARVDGRLVVALVPVERRLDLKALAATVEGKRAEMAAPVDVQRATGYVVGGISPIGLRNTLPTVVDDSLLGNDLMWVSGGRRGVEIGIVPGDLIALLDAKTAAIGG